MNTKPFSISKQQASMLAHLQTKITHYNLDNIARTMAYQRFYQRHPEIRWALLASLVSRNAGYHMTDLQSKWFQQLVNQEQRALLFCAYERANWLIFKDAYPQLLLYEWSKRKKQPLFDLLKHFNVSRFMKKEWELFWEKRDEQRLCTALIINEQHVIQSSVIDHPSFRERVFRSFPFFLEEQGHFGAVLFPVLEGKLYGLYVRDFRRIDARIWLGKQLQQLLFHPDYFQHFYTFATSTEHTGSRRDYGRYLQWETTNTSPFLRIIYPIVNHRLEEKKDWYEENKQVEAYFAVEKGVHPQERTSWVQKKQLELFLLYQIKKKLT
ncbi:DUF2515 domain-containing protein [Halalkalibacterium ligniniphilum]|uniref:DUF2515 domain-containing protein n=1 Tax=Halalkalibacterium ligniniphilum TaxID=1134413 RepID=UPI00034680F4|nr:DUF2515 domain-containing protein [Halalkalibacterium ligniniphilum]